MIEKPVEFNIDGIVMRGILEQPENDSNKMPLLIILHGLTGNMNEPHLLAISRVAVESGYATLRFDQYGHGTSDGEFYNHDVIKWVMYACSIIDIASKWEFVSEIILTGHSQGGLTTVLVGGIMQDKLKAIIPLSPAINIANSSKTGDLLGVRFNPNNLPNDITLMSGHTISSNYLRVARMLPVESSILSFTKPVLIVHGTADSTVPFSIATELEDLYSCASLVAIEGAEHCFDGHLDELATSVGLFLNVLKMNKI